MNAYQQSLKKQLATVKRNISDVEHMIRLRKKHSRNLTPRERDVLHSDITELEKQLRQLQEDYSYIVVEM